MKPLLSTVTLAAMLLTARANAECVPQHTMFNNVERRYTLCVPATAKPDLPVLLLLHGSGSNGAYIASLWKDFAAREGIILIAPDALHNDAWHLKDDSPDFLHAIVNGVQSRTAADRQRLYLFGQSGGAVYALTLAMLESQYYAAVAVHAGGWRSPAEYKVMQFARRKIPLKIIAGDRDKYFSTVSVRSTKDGLEAAGFPIELELVPGQHHEFTTEIAPATEESTWRFLAPIVLTGAPVFVQYPQVRR